MILHNIHVFFVFFAVAAIALADHEVFGWIFGKKDVLSHKKMHYVHLTVWFALLSLIVSGSLLFIPRYDYLLRQPLFVIKLLFVAILIANAIIIGNLMKMSTTRSFHSISWQEKFPLLISGAISSASWSSVIAIGLYLFYPW